MINTIMARLFLKHKTDPQRTFCIAPSTRLPVGARGDYNGSRQLHDELKRFVVRVNEIIE